MLLANVFRINGFSEVSEKTKMMEVIEVPGLHGMEAEMGAMRMMEEVKIGGKSFKNMFRAAIYEEVGMSQYFISLMMDQRLRGFLTMCQDRVNSGTISGMSGD